VDSTDGRFSSRSTGEIYTSAADTVSSPSGPVVSTSSSAVSKWSALDLDEIAAADAQFTQ